MVNLLPGFGLLIIPGQNMKGAGRMKLHDPAKTITEAKVAIKLLREGNQRYVSGNLSDKTSFSRDHEILNKGQKPFAAVICCSDSRVAPEISFD